MISIVDYGLGNIRAFMNVFKRLNIEAHTATTPDELRGADKVILPGVGHFDHAMQRLEESGMRAVLDELALVRKVPVLGVCVGMQMLGSSSEEGDLAGLGWIDARVRHFGSMMPAVDLPLPHMGWNDVRPMAGHPLFAGLDRDARFYFLHSYYFECTDPSNRLAEASYGGDFACAVTAGNIFGVQFHPEKSHSCGTRLLQNFAEL
jgi:glutamine amidotransferase